MFALYLALHFSGITLCTGILEFSQTPGSEVYFQKGSDAVLIWDYDKADGLKSTIWEVYNKSQSTYEFLRIEDENGTNLEDPDIPPAAYVGRLKRTGKAALIIKNITLEDSTSFKCTLKGQPGVGRTESTTTLVVTGPCSVDPQVQTAEVGGSVTFTCNAANVPSQEFNWMRGVQASEKIVNDSQHSVVSVAGSSQLTIEKIATHDLGYYVCNATVNINQPCLSRGYLQELADPVKTVPCPTKPYYASVGKNQAICCPVSGYPPPIVTWQKNGSELQKGENKCLTITLVNEEDFGIYTCTATNFEISVDPCNISILEEPGLLLESKDGTDTMPAKLKWVPKAGAAYYVVEITGDDVLDDLFIGTKPSLELHYHALVMEKADENPEVISIRAEVSAIIGEGVTKNLTRLTIKKPSDTLN